MIRNRKTSEAIIVAALLLGGAVARAQQAEPAQPPAEPSSAQPPASQPAAASQQAANALADQVARQEEQLRAQQQQLAGQREELENLIEELAAARSERERVASEKAKADRSFSMYGFFDLNFRKMWLPEQTRLAEAVDSDPMFVFGNLNTYLDWKPLSHWRMLAEVRFLLNPLGDVASYAVPLQGVAFQRVNVTTSDAASFGERFDYGSIEIERAVIEWTRLPWLSVAAGLFLTPYGIWNIDHGSPTRTMASAPLLYAVNFFPERQLGIKLFGNRPLGDLTLAYALTFSNGRGPVNTLKESDWDKAVGARVELSALGAVPWKAGVSFYTGRYTDEEQIVDIRIDPASGAFDVDILRETTVRYREVALAADLDIDADPLLLQAELFVNWRHFHDDYRPPAGYYMTPFFPSGIPTNDELEPNTVGWGASALLRYRLPMKRVNLRPFFAVAWLNMTDNIKEENLVQLSFGLNWRIRGAVVLKLEYHYGHYPNKSDPPMLMVGANDSHLIVSQLAIAF